MRTPWPSLRFVALRRGAVLLLPVLAAAWASGCADEADPATPDVDVDAGDAAPDTTPEPPKEAGSDAPPGRDCAGDLDADGVTKHLECSGLYASFADKTIAADVKPYAPGVGFWSDGAEKARWVYLPPGSKIDITDFDEWVFPVGTKFWKEFKIGGKRVETRLFTKLEDDWAHTTYRWNDDETDAVRKDGGESIPGAGPDGGAYEIPNRGQCEMCHNGRKDHILGFDAVSLGLPTATGQTLATLAAEGWLSAPPPKTALTFPGSAAATAAVGWVNANCGACHNANTNAAATFKSHYLVRATDLAPTDGGAPKTVEQLDVYTQAYCKKTAGTTNYIEGGDPSKSEMSIRAGRRVPADQLPNNSQMPPIVTRAVDHEGLALLNAWITSLPPCP